MAVKLTKAQSAALQRMKETPRSSAYTMKVSMATLEALERKGLAKAFRGLGSMAFPKTAIKWVAVP